jgi:hypothetical protein
LGLNEALTLFFTMAPFFLAGLPSPRGRQGEADGL